MNAPPNVLGKTNWPSIPYIYNSARFLKLISNTFHFPSTVLVAGGLIGGLIQTSQIFSHHCVCNFCSKRFLKNQTLLQWSHAFLGDLLLRQIIKLVGLSCLYMIYFRSSKIPCWYRHKEYKSCMKTTFATIFVPKEVYLLAKKYRKK